MLNTSLKQLFLSEATLNEKKKNDFNKDLGLALVTVIFKLKYTGKHIPDESALRKNYFEPIFEYFVFLKT
ncbi:Uncharacterized protein FWK35_00025576 [Aphis craccivora]|uniref:Uncharacterized protein n=1 Tax=Aphis craccivora TaxID=307492 RepID=A0A6G0YV88_APHCR|nr:Uncharacterized protein FWK35_00025576 [Aphis craccivora]